MEQLFGVLLSLYRGTPKHGEWVVACLQGAWPRLIGDKLASVCHPSRYEDSELLIEIEDPDWEEAVRSVKPLLLEKLRAATAGEVKTISVQRK